MNCIIWSYWSNSWMTWLDLVLMRIIILSPTSGPEFSNNDSVYLQENECDLGTKSPATGQRLSWCSSHHSRHLGFMMLSRCANILQIMVKSENIYGVSNYLSRMSLRKVILLSDWEVNKSQVLGFRQIWLPNSALSIFSCVPLGKWLKSSGPWLSYQ